MAGYSWSVAIFFLQFVTVSVSSQYFPNHKYEHESDLSFNRETDQKQRDRLALDFNQIKYPPIYFPSQLHSPLQEDQLANEIKLKPQDAERKLTIHDDHEYTPKTSALKDKRIYENFVTPKEESSLKRYEVTTKKFIDTDPASLTSSAVGLDNDVAIALDDNEDIDDGVVQPESSRPEHLNPLVYLDSYGRLHGKGQSPRVAGQGFGYGVLHPKTSPRHLYSKKATGRVRMQVFRGPTRIVGHKRYAPWGYFVVQPADNYGPHHYPGPPYYRPPLTEDSFLGSLKEVVETRMVQVEYRAQHPVVGRIIWDLYHIIPREWQVYVLGSVAIGLAGPTSDIDLYIDQGNYYPVELNKKDRSNLQSNLIYLYLTKNGINSELFALKNVICCTPRVPLLRCVHVRSEWKLDISTANGLGVENSNLLRLYLSSDPRVKWVVVVVHEWCKVIGILGGLPLFRPYALTWLVLFALMQTSPPAVLPLCKLQAGLPPRMIAGWDCRIPDHFPKTENKQSRIQLLIHFLHFMISLDPKSNVICPLIGEIVPRVQFCKPQELPSSMNLYKERVARNPQLSLKTNTAAMCLQDPFELHHNTMRGIDEYNVKQMVKMCKDSVMVNHLLLRPIVDVKHDDLC